MLNKNEVWPWREVSEMTKRWWGGWAWFLLCLVISYFVMRLILPSLSEEKTLLYALAGQVATLAGNAREAKP